MHDFFLLCLILGGCLSLTLFITMLSDSLDIGKAFVWGIFWPILLVIMIIKSFIEEIKNV